MKVTYDVYHFWSEYMGQRVAHGDPWKRDTATSENSLGLEIINYFRDNGVLEVGRVSVQGCKIVQIEGTL